MLDRASARAVAACLRSGILVADRRWHQAKDYVEINGIKGGRILNVVLSGEQLQRALTDCSQTNRVHRGLEACARIVHRQLERVQETPAPHMVVSGNLL